ncbi:MAG: DNA polymerase III subunit delta [candidate division Zixibacteria bacterium]|nr:DNA polymerase III subunit delta [candidate division Zixibacteria bacterium]
MAKEPVSKLKFSDVIKQLEQNQIAPIYFFTGDQEYLRLEFTQAIIKALFGEDRQNATIEKIQAKPGKAAEMVNAAMEYSLFGGGRLVIVTEAERYNEKDQKLILKVLPTIPPENKLVIFHPGKLDLRKKFYKFMTNEATWVSFLALDQRGAKFWVRRQEQKHDLTLEPGAVDLLIEFAGYSYRTLAEEIDKIALNMEPGATVTSSDIRSYGSQSAVFSIFELTDALGRRDRQTALNRLERLLSAREKFTDILRRVYGHFNYLYGIEALEPSLSDKAVASRIRVHPFFVKKCRQQLRNFSRDDLSRALNSLFEAEYDSRFERMPQNYILERLIVKLTESPE